MKSRNKPINNNQVIDLQEVRFSLAVRKGYRNWTGRFKEGFSETTQLSQISLKTLSYLAQGREKGTFYIYDLIMNLKDLGSGFEFNELNSDKKMAVIDLYLFLLDQIRFECMKRLGWLESYPAEGFTLVDLVMQHDKTDPILQAKTPVLSRNHPDYKHYSETNTFDREGFIRKLIPKALEEINRYSETS